MYARIHVIVGRRDLDDDADHNIYLHPEDSNGHQLTAVRLGTTTIQTTPEEVSPLDLATLFERWAQEIRAQVAPEIPETPWQAAERRQEADFTPSGSTA